MLTILVSETDFFNEHTQMIEKKKSQNIQLEHSLISLSKWESVWNIPFLSGAKLTEKQWQSYVQCMAVGTYDREFFYRLSNKNYFDIEKYMNASMTATTFKKRAGRPNNEILTSEVLYHRMISHGIPFECQKWHLNRLLTLIRVCDEKDGPQKKMTKQETAMRNAQLNAARRSKLKTRG